MCISYYVYYNIRCFDFAHLIKLVSGQQQLPIDLQGFKNTLRYWIPNYIDLKYLVKNHPHFQCEVRMFIYNISEYLTYLKNKNLLNQL